MATLTLSRDELEERSLPPYCLCCGAPATHVEQKLFTWGPGWLMAVILFGLICAAPLFLFALALLPLCLERMKVAVPLCNDHRDHGRSLQQLLTWGIAILVLLVVAMIVLFVLFFAVGQAHNNPYGPLASGSVILTVGWLLAIVIPAAIMHTKVIRATEITPRGITLTNVAKEFVRRVEERRSRPPWEVCQ